MSERINGVVKWFSNERGFGFVLAEEDDGKEEGSGEYFAHFSSIIMEGYKTLKAGQKVSFELLETEKGVQATNIMVEE